MPQQKQQAEQQGPDLYQYFFNFVYAKLNIQLQKIKDLAIKIFIENSSHLSADCPSFYCILYKDISIAAKRVDSAIFTESIAEQPSNALVFSLLPHINTIFSEKTKLDLYEVVVKKLINERIWPEPSYEENMQLIEKIISDTIIDWTTPNYTMAKFEYEQECKRVREQERKSIREEERKSIREERKRRKDESTYMTAYARKKLATMSTSTSTRDIPTSDDKTIVCKT